ncbi:N-acyl homoserine lactonase family protein [Conexibacter arvalis]|uniref:Glyoxylase-like metal-dependent hydrolase (Beta-lactamase superfamily II) n=1 Tax=Conexibacter arvalis TaxID=912552 RepID=A0A840IER6_9ACTN|nr:N-acyl homoserine lactonase family protein [Conexibacter arvalis]MBB4662721.1 glyoxylase-like metal-dependent hydrolase (beta-lactamase superfamily II) [Conexibacter arvalis]
MDVATVPKPLTHPLPGGQEGATVRLHPLLCGEMLAPHGYVERGDAGPARLREALGALGPRSRWAALPVPAFLVEHPTAGALLVDTGFHPSVVDGQRANMGRAGAILYTVRTSREQLVAAQLEQRGIAPTDVRTVVMTHLHIDHASAVSEFPAATFVVDRREWEAGASRGWRAGYHPRQFDHAFDWRALDYDGPAIDSFATFGRSFDLFGDGSVRLLSTPGHTAGHQSVLLRLGGREALLCGDAAYTWRTLRDGALPALTDDEHRFRRSLREITRYLEQTPSALAIPGHDAEAWPRLERVYD